MTIECLRYKSYTKGSLQGFADLYIPKTGLEIYGCSIHQKDGRKWLNMPSKEYQNDDGETKWSHCVRFRERAHMDAFSKLALKAIDDWCISHAEQECSQETPADPNDGIPF